MIRIRKLVFFNPLNLPFLVIQDYLLSCYVAVHYYSRQWRQSSFQFWPDDRKDQGVDWLFYLFLQREDGISGIRFASCKKIQPKKIYLGINKYLIRLLVLSDN